MNEGFPGLSADQKKRTAAQIACGALRYFMLKYARNSLIIFDFGDALSFEGETGPYLQYSSVRLNSIFRKMEEREGKKAADLEKLGTGAEMRFESLSQDELADLWDVVSYASRFEEEVLHSIQSLEFSHLAKFTFNLCQKFNGYYHKYPVLAEENSDLKSIRIMVILYVREVLARSLDLMGIPVPERM